MNELETQYGRFVMLEDNLRFPPEKKSEIESRLIIYHRLPQFDCEISKVSYDDGCKIYFADNSFVSCRFSGTEPLLRIFAEARSRDSAKQYIDFFKAFLGCLLTCVHSALNFFLLKQLNKIKITKVTPKHLGPCSISIFPRTSLNRTCVYKDRSGEHFIQRAPRPFLYAIDPRWRPGPVRCRSGRRTWLGGVRR